MRLAGGHAAEGVARIDGTATPLGPWYSGMSKHYIDYVVSTSGSSNFTILIATAVVAGTAFSLLSAARPVVALPDDDTAPVLALIERPAVEEKMPPVLPVSVTGAVAVPVQNAALV